MQQRRVRARRSVAVPLGRPNAILRSAFDMGSPWMSLLQLVVSASGVRERSTTDKERAALQFRHPARQLSGMVLISPFSENSTGLHNAEPSRFPRSPKSHPPPVEGGHGLSTGLWNEPL